MYFSVFEMTLIQKNYEKKNYKQTNRRTEVGGGGGGDKMTSKRRKIYRGVLDKKEF